MKKLSIIFDKKVRIIALLLSLTLFFDVFFYDYKSANATGTGVAVAAAASTAIPVAGPFIAITLCAVGAIGAIEWCRTHPDEVESIRKDLVNALNDAGESYAEGVKTNNDANTASQVAGKEWIKSNIVDGKNYISEKILDTCLGVYSKHGLLNGVKQNVDYSQNISIGNTFTLNTYDVYTYLDSLTFPSDVLKSINSETIKAMDLLGTKDIVFNIDSVGWLSGLFTYSFSIYRKSDLANCTVYNKSDYGNESYGTHGTKFTLKNKGDSFSYYSGEVIDNGNIHSHGLSTLNPDSFIRYIFRGISRYRLGGKDYPSDKPSSYAINPDSNIGSLISTGIETSDRVAKKNPTTGAWELPWDTGANVNVEGVGDSYPVSIPWENSYVWNPSKVDYPDIALPFPTDLDIPYPDIPITGVQEKIQTGEIELPEPIPNEPEIQENEQSYMLPKWIEDRFPFCIPKDLTSLASLFSSTSREPPEWLAKLTYGDNKEFNIPINFKYKSADGSVSFDRIAYICRLIQFILFLAGLMIVTRNLLRS